MNNSAESRNGAFPALCAMMFLQFAVYGLWIPLASRFLSADPETEGGLGFGDGQISLILVFSGSFGAIFAPFLVQLADRYFAADRLLASLLIVGGVIKYLTASQTTFSAWLILSVAYTLVYMPTIALTNAIAMRNLTNPTAQYAKVRVWGTIGWIAVAWFFPVLWLKTNVSFQWLPPFFIGDSVQPIAERMLDSLRVAGVLSVLYGVFAFFILPRTPPNPDAAGRKTFVLAKAMSLLGRRSVTALLLATLFVSMVHFLYFPQTGKFLALAGLDDAYIMPAMSIGQISEIFFMAVLAWMLTRLGFTKIFLIGAFCYSVRYAIFSAVDLPLWIIVASQALHGACFALFFAAAFIYVDRVAPADLKSTAQAIYTFVMYGIGPLLSVALNIILSRRYAGEDGKLDISGYSHFWFAAAVLGMGAVVIVMFGFRDETKDDLNLET